MKKIIFIFLSFASVTPLCGMNLSDSKFKTKNYATPLVHAITCGTGALLASQLPRSSAKYLALASLLGCSVYHCIRSLQKFLYNKRRLQASKHSTTHEKSTQGVGADSLNRTAPSVVKAPKKIFVVTEWLLNCLNQEGQEESLSLKNFTPSVYMQKFVHLLNKNVAPYYTFEFVKERKQLQATQSLLMLGNVEGYRSADCMGGYVEALSHFKDIPSKFIVLLMPAKDMAGWPRRFNDNIEHNLVAHNITCLKATLKLVPSEDTGTIECQLDETAKETKQTIEYLSSTMLKH